MRDANAEESTAAEWVGRIAHKVSLDVGRLNAMSSKKSHVSGRILVLIQVIERRKRLTYRRERAIFR